MTPESAKKFQDDGFLVIKDFLSDDDIVALQRECALLVDSMDPSQHRSIFSTTNTVNLRDDYFITSADKVRYFFEEHAFDSEGKLLVDKHLALNKIGHALHVLCPTFKRVTHSEQVKSVVASLGFLDPVLVQSMYIFKQPCIGGKVTPHQDASYLHARPRSAAASKGLAGKGDGRSGVLGLWIALEDATLNNGCLSFIPHSHQGGLNGDYRLVRSPQEDGSVKLVFEGALPQYDQSLFVPCPVSKGSLVLIDGLVVHQSEANKSERSRHIYTFHVYDSARYTWEPSCWLQETSGSPFVHLSEA